MMNDFHRGFTVLELLVASLLLGMLMTILAMIFNQSAIAWKTGESRVIGVDDACVDISDVRYQADSGYEWNEDYRYIHSVFDADGKVLEQRDDYINEQVSDYYTPNRSITLGDGKTVTDSYNKDVVSISDTKVSGSADNYTVNVMSWGPDGKEKTRYDNIYSAPDDPSEW